jgi:hypothetical protein
LGLHTGVFREPKDNSAISSRHYHGRQVEAEPRPCAAPGCAAPGEFRAPLSNRAPGDRAGWQYFCLEHVRAFNQRYNFFDGLSPDEIHEAQSPLAGWETILTEKGRQAFHFGDAHALFGSARRPGKAAMRWPGAGDAQALGALGLDDNATALSIRRTYKALVRRYHPDSNGGDRAHEGKLQAIVAAYTHLRAQPRFKLES